MTATIHPFSPDAPDPERDANLPPQPPYSMVAEEALLGLIMLNNEALYRVAGYLSPLHFYDRVHCDIYDACLDAIDAGQRADPVTLHHRFADRADLKDRGGAQYLANLATRHLGGLNVDEYARTIHDLWRRRELIKLAHDIYDAAYDRSNEATADEMVEDFAAVLDRIGDNGPDRESVVTLEDAWRDALDHSDKVFKGEVSPGLMTGLRDLDALLSGLQPGDLCTLAGRTSMGKTALAWAITGRVAARGDRVLFFSMEMSSRQLAYRAGAAEINTPSSMIARPTQHTLMAAARVNFKGMPVEIEPTPALNVNGLVARARRIHRKRPLKLIVVDHIGMMRPTAETVKAGRVQQIGEITKGLKALAKELGCPVIALSQLNREVEKRDGNKPTLPDLRDSGNIEEDSDQVMFVYREEYYLDRSVPSDDELAEHEAALARARNVMEVIVAKNRNGPTGVARLYCNVATNRIGDLARQEPLP